MLGSELSGELSSERIRAKAVGLLNSAAVAAYTGSGEDRANPHSSVDVESAHEAFDS